MSKISIKRGTEQALLDNNPILNDGELIFSTDTLKLKVSDGINNYSSLPTLFSGVYQPSGNYSTVGHTHIASQITDFNGSVSGLVNGIYAPLNNPNFNGALSVGGTPLSEIIDDEVAGLLVAGSGINLNYNDVSNTLTVDTNVTTSLVAGTGISLVYNTTTDELSINTNLTSSNISNFNSSVSGLLPITSILAGNNISVATSGTSITISSSSSTGLNIKLGTIMALS